MNLYVKILQNQNLYFSQKVFHIILQIFQSFSLALTPFKAIICLFSPLKEQENH